MSTKELSPVDAAMMAEDVYLVGTARGLKTFEKTYQNDIDATSQSIVSGKTGGFVVLKKRQAMALVATGKKGGRYENQGFIAVKGTASLYDAASDLNTGVRNTETGCAAHQGFLYAFNSLKNELELCLKNLSGVGVIHCIGHSLGGAIATLIADWLNNRGGSYKVKLYTFGSPRVGMHLFASVFTRKFLPENIYRVYHRTDPVPMVPTWPFYHVPTYGSDYLIDSPSAFPPWKYHKMEHYGESVSIAGSWAAIKSNRPKAHLDSAVERWLKADGLVSITATTLDMLNASFIYIFRKVQNIGASLVVTGFAASLTLLDRMAILLAKSVQLSSKISSWVFYLVRKMAKIIGVVVKEGADLTVALIRSVFIRLQQRISDMMGQIGRFLA